MQNLHRGVCDKVYTYIAGSTRCWFDFRHQDQRWTPQEVFHFQLLFLASGSISGVVACLALAVRCSKFAMVPSSWLVTWVVYSIVAFTLMLLPMLLMEEEWHHRYFSTFETSRWTYFSDFLKAGGGVSWYTSSGNKLLTGLLVTAGYNSLFHVFVMAVLILRRITVLITGTNNDWQAPQASLDASAQTVVLSAKLTCLEELFLATIGRIIQLVDLFIWIVSMIGIDLSPFFFPLPVCKFYHASSPVITASEALASI